MKNKFWFRKRRGIRSKDRGYGWIPISWKGYVMVLLFILINVLGMLYFGFPYREDSIINFMITLVLSIAVFSIIAKYKTKK